MIFSMKTSTKDGPSLFEDYSPRTQKLVLEGHLISELLSTSL